MTPPARPRLSLSWEKGDRWALIVLTAVWAGILAVGVFNDRAMGERLPIDAAAVEAVRERIDPNTAPAGSLRRLRDIGPAMAEAIIQYRQSVPPGRRAFESAADLEPVPGIGPATIAGIAGDLSLPATAPSP